MTLSSKIPAFTSTDDVQAWMARRIKETYKTKRNLLCSDEYREAFPRLAAVFRQAPDEYTSRMAREGTRALAEAGLAVGDRVAYGLVGPFFNIEVLRGKIVSRKGVPYVALDQAHNGKKSVRWHKGWTAEILPLGNPR